MGLRVLVLTLALVAAPVLAGCIGDGETDEPVDEQVFAAPGEGLDTSMLTEPVFDILPRLVEYVEATLDGIQLYSEVYLPDGEGPWPTILINSPYYDHGISGVFERRVDSGMIEHFVPRGYAVVVADVRGTGNSEGCMNMMGAKEQQDAHDLVEWVAQQPWSDGKVGMWGFSYVGTTPNEAAIMAPEHLVTIVTGAGVTNQWRNTFQNGVPYALRFYPITYEVVEGAPPPGNVDRGPAWALNAAQAACGQEEALAAMSPGTYEKGVYTDYWHERNLTRGAANVTASVFYWQGFADRAVNPMESLHWFNELDVPKRAWFHPFGHLPPPRADIRDSLHGWFDFWLKGIDNGVMDAAPVEVMLNDGSMRQGTAWPPLETSSLRLHLAPGALVEAPPAQASEAYLADMVTSPAHIAYLITPVGDIRPDPELPGLPRQLTYVSEPFDERVHLAGVPRIHLEASADAENTYFLMDLYDVDGETWTPITECWFNAHLRDGFDRSSPLTPGEPTTFRFKCEPQEYFFDAGHAVGLVIRGHDGRVFPVDELVTENTVYYGPEGSHVDLPVLFNVSYVRPPGAPERAP